MTRLFFVFSIFIFTAGSAFAQGVTPIAPTRTISVNGEAEVRVVPDQVIISLTAETRGADLIDAQKQNDASIAKLIDYAAKSGVEKKHIQTDFASVEPSYQNCRYEDEMSGKCNPLQITYYNVRKGVQIRLNNLDGYEGLINTALRAGITHIDNVQFITTELRKHRDEARKLAAIASKEKAQALAETLGVKLGKPMNINANQWTSFYHHGSGQRAGNTMMQNTIQSAPAGNGAGSDGSALALGQINITAQVNVTYEIE
ncbi:MAG: SIMPL domain-containing protein [Alcanivorax sp.]